MSLSRQEEFRDYLTGEPKNLHQFGNPYRAVDKKKQQVCNSYECIICSTYSQQSMTISISLIQSTHSFINRSG